MESLIGILPVLALLACPLMMVFCFWGMRRMGCGTDEATSATEPVAAAGDHNLPVAEQITALRNRLDQLQTEQDVIGAQLTELALMEASRVAPDRDQDQLNLATSDRAIASLDS